MQEIFNCPYVVRKMETTLPSSLARNGCESAMNGIDRCLLLSFDEICSLVLGKRYQVHEMFDVLTES